jgi:ATP-dependent Clp protease ATP-binding subunit ClpA
MKIAQLEMDIIDSKLMKKGYVLNYDEAVLNGLVEKGVDTIYGARGMSRVRRDEIEAPLADSIMSSTFPRGSIFEIDYLDNLFTINTIKGSKPKD